MAEIPGTARKAGVQVGFGCGELLRVIRMDGENDPLVHHFIHLGELMAFVLVDDKESSRFDPVKFIVDQELFPALDGIVDLIAVVDVHFHGILILVQVSDGKSLALNAGFDGLFAGIQLFHGPSPPSACKRLHKYPFIIG